MNGYLKFASFFVLLTVATYGVALRCYVCDYKWILRFSTRSGVDCLGPNVNARYMQTCPSNQKYCKTQEIKTYYHGYLVERSIARSCSYLLTFNKPNRTGTYLTFCQTDGCNTGNAAASLLTAKHVSLTATMVVIHNFCFD